MAVYFLSHVPLSEESKSQLKETNVEYQGKCASLYGESMTRAEEPPPLGPLGCYKQVTTTNMNLTTTSIT